MTCAFLQKLDHGCTDKDYRCLIFIDEIIIMKIFPLILKIHPFHENAIILIIIFFKDCLENPDL